MLKIIMRFILLACLLITSLSALSGCGSSGISGEGKTVYLTASGKSGSSFTIDTDLMDSTFQYLSGSFDYTITSTAYPGSTGIKSSNVTITEAQISYLPMGPAPGPALYAWTKYVGGKVTPGGTLDLTMTVIDSSILSYFDENSPTVTAPNSRYRYKVSVVFKGIEENTGTSISCYPVETNIYITKNDSNF